MDIISNIQRVSLIIIDECHRGSANEEGSWRDILDYFGEAVHLGLTATPKRKDNVDTYDYFGQPVYEYSLKDGINDGYLTPYKVKRIKTNIDEYIYTSEDQIVEGTLAGRQAFGLSDFNRNIVVRERTELVAKAILENIRPMDKTIVFCVNQDHAADMRDFINQYKSVADVNYCVRVTSVEGKIGRTQLERFQDNDKDIPVILTSSQMLTTGVDARNVRNIVLTRTIGSMVEFKQIIGRGTRLFEGKDFFTILDFTGATEKFYDPEWDGPPKEEVETIPIYDIPVEEEPDELDDEHDEPDDYKPRRKLEVKLSENRKLKVIDIETRYVGADGKPMTATEFLESLIGRLPSLYEGEEQLREIWKKPDTRKALLEQLVEFGFAEEQMQLLKRMFDAEDSDVFDILNHISHRQDLITRRERAAKVKGDSRFFEVYSNLKAKDFLNFILERYEKDGIKELERDKLSELIKLNNLGTTKEAAQVFGSREKLLQAFYKLQEKLYQAS